MEALIPPYIQAALCKSWVNFRGNPKSEKRIKAKDTSGGMHSVYRETD